MMVNALPLNEMGILMGVLTSTYHVPSSILDQVIANPALIESLFYPEYREPGDPGPEDVGLPADWEPKDYGFDKAWEDFVKLYNQTGHRDLASALEREVTEIEHDGGAWIRYWSPETIQQIVAMMSAFTAEEFLAECLAVENLTDWDGEPWEEFMLEIRTRMHGTFGEYLMNIAGSGDAMVGVTQ